MKLKSNIIDPYIGQTAEGKKINFESKESIQRKELKVFKFESKNQYIKIQTKEFIAVCPFSGLPDIAKINIEYYAKGGVALELKALKYYLISYKNVGIYQEEVTKTIYNDLSDILKTKKIKITSKYNIRGGLLTTCSKGNL
jgi:7-cyano-7-deazaguanine reductase